MASQPNRTALLAGLGASIVGAIATGTTIGLNSSNPTASVTPLASASSAPTSPGAAVTPLAANQSRQTVPALPDGIAINRQMERTAQVEPTGVASQGAVTPSRSPVADRWAGEESVERCEVRMVRAADPKPPLNLRAEPRGDAALLGTIENGTYLSVKQEAGGWFQVEAEPSGQRVTAWVAANLTEHNCSYKESRLRFAAGKTGMQVADRFIGVGSHTYKLAASEGQRLSLAAQSGMVGVMPMVTDPSGKVLFDGQREGDDESWSELLVQSGDYQLVFDSNFKGYRYGVYVEVK